MYGCHKKFRIKITLPILFLYPWFQFSKLNNSGSTSLCGVANHRAWSEVGMTFCIEDTWPLFGTTFPFRTHFIVPQYFNWLLNLWDPAFFPITPLSYLKGLKMYQELWQNPHFPFCRYDSLSLCNITTSP